MTIPPDHVAIIGAGFSGTLQTIGLLRAGVKRISLIERRTAFGRGVAYSTSNPAHLLNVRTSKMSALDDDPDHFRRWLTERAGSAPHGFASRRDFGDYLADLLDRHRSGSPGTIELRHDQAIEVDCRPDGVTVGLDSGARIIADVAILAIGNLPPHDPPMIAGTSLPPDLYVGDPWSGTSGDGLRPEDMVAVIGTGLTMIDVVLTLEAQGFSGRIVALSRHGLVPHDHDVAAPTNSALWRPATTGAALIREFRARADDIGWRSTVDGIRPYVQELWQAASPAEQARFIRHLRPWWDVHRHRLAPAIAERLESWRRSGRLTIAAGRITGCTADTGSVEIAWRPRGGGTERQLRVRRVINCTGPQGDLLRTREPLLHLLLASGRVRPDRHRLGIDVNPRGETIGVDGRPNPRLLAIGPMTRGAFWEVVAVPDIRVQAAALARRLAGTVGA